MKRNSEQWLHGAVAKRRKVPKNSLCNLPMDILSTILSLLPINDAIRTSVLSRKLKHVWCSHSNLTFDKDTMRKTYSKPSTGHYGVLRDKEFIAKVDTVLHQHSGMGVEHMEIKCGLHNKHEDHIDRWVNFGIASKTKEFVIDLSGRPKSLFFTELVCRRRVVREQPYSLPSELFKPNSGSYLRCLELRTVSLQLPSDFKGFLNLKSLTLVDVSITDEDVQSFGSGYLPKLQEIELNCSPTTLKYNGAMVPLIFASTSRLTNISVVLLTCQSALSYIVTGFPSTSPKLKTLTLLCYERERTIVPEGPFRFTYLRNLRLELIISNYVYLLKIAPFMETLELSMWMKCQHRPYCKRTTS